MSKKTGKGDKVKTEVNVLPISWRLFLRFRFSSFTFPLIFRVCHCKFSQGPLFVWTTQNGWQAQCDDSVCIESGTSPGKCQAYGIGLFLGDILKYDNFSSIDKKNYTGEAAYLVIIFLRNRVLFFVIYTFSNISCKPKFIGYNNLYSVVNFLFVVTGVYKDLYLSLAVTVM